MDAGDVTTFPVRYSEGVFDRSDNSFGFIGAGTVALSKDSLIVSGRTRGFFGCGRRNDALQFAIADVANVTSHGAQLRMELRSAGHAPRAILLWTEDEAAARRMLALLPPRQTDDFRAATAESNEFVQRLEALGNKAYASRVLIAANVGIFVAMAFAGAGLMATDPQVHIRWGSNFAPLTATGEWWRLLSSTFLHFGLIHLLLNMWCLHAFGTLTERLYGSTRFVSIYLCAGVSGSFLSMMWNPGVNSAGASGAIFGVLGALIAFVVDKRNAVPRSIVMAQRSSLFAFVGYNLVFGAIHPAIDNAAHIGGLIAGALLGATLSRPLDPEARARSAASREFLTTVAWVGLAFIAYQAIRADDALQQDQHFRLNAAWMAQAEPAVLRRYATLTSGLMAGQIAEPEFIKGMEADVVPFWDEAVRRLAGGSIDGKSRLRALRAAYRDYVLSRKKSTALFVEGARDGDLGKIDAAWREVDRSQKLIETLSGPGDRDS